MGARQFFDGLINALTGAGGSHDPRSYNQYAFIKLNDQQVEAAFRSSWLMRKGIVKPATEMVREGRDWQADKEDIAKLEAEEKRLGLKSKLLLAEVLRGLGGAGMVLYVKDDDPEQPIEPARVKAGALLRVHVWHRSAFNLGEMILDWEDPWFGHPSFYEVQLQSAAGARPMRFHPSRVIAFRGEPTGSLALRNWQDDWWGDSKVQVVKDAVDNVHAGEDGFAALIKDARNRRLYVPKLTERVSTAEKEAQMTSRVAALATGESLFGVTFLDAGGKDGEGAEKLDDRQMVWAGIPDIKQSNLSVAAAAFNMPETVLLGRSPAGMNATGKSDANIWEQEVKSRQDLQLRPCLDQLDAALIPSALGRVDDSIWWTFSPLSVMSEKDEAETFDKTASALNKIQLTGAVPDIAFEKALQNLLEERGWMPGLGDALAELPEDERFPSLAEPDPNDPNADPALDDPSAIGGRPQPQRQQQPQQPDRRRATNDAQPRTLYVRRNLLNADEFIAWAKGQGFETTTPADDLHVTIMFSRTPVDWMKMGAADWSVDAKGNLEVAPGGARIVEPLGDKGAVVLMFASSALTWRHEDMRRNGTSFDYDEYQPHVTITYQPPAGLDLSKVEPYRGKLLFGPEIFEEVVEDWARNVGEE